MKTKIQNAIKQYIIAVTWDILQPLEQGNKIQAYQHLLTWFGSENQLVNSGRYNSPLCLTTIWCTNCCYSLVHGKACWSKGELWQIWKNDINIESTQRYIDGLYDLLRKV